jgi:cobyrinic acid a,c-diamide synthase
VKLVFGCFWNLPERRGVILPKHAFLIAGTHSGCGKTTVALGLLCALRARGLRVQPFKVGPDFIDPGLHAQAAGCESRNLDGWMLSSGYNRGLFHRLLEQADVAVVEGVMGLFDGYDGLTESGSSAEMAKWLGIPAVLAVDARSMARSAAALVQGFAAFDSGLRMAGVIFNRVGGPAHLEYLKESMAANLPGLPVFGGIPREERVSIPERHLGLVTADEMQLGDAWRADLAGLIERSLDIGRLLRETRYETAAGSGPDARAPLKIPPGPPLEKGGDAGPVPIAVARDAAFCFYYPDNFELLRNAGAELRFFSPAAGESFPEDAAGLYLGGGYPELFAEAISRNRRFLDSVRERAARGMPVYAECGGLMALARYIETMEGARYPMAGVLPFSTRMLDRRKALGYTEVALRAPCLLGAPGTVIRGHEFHYSEIEGMEDAPSLDLVYELRRRKGEAVRTEGYAVGQVLASYIHLHWGSAPEAAAAFAGKCREWMRSKM